MKIINVAEAGACTDGKTDCSGVLNTLFLENPADTEFFFPAGRYYLYKDVPVSHAAHITLRGENAVLITHFSPCGDPSENNDAFQFSDCSDLTITGFTCTTDVPVNNAGRVIAKDEAARTYDVKIDADFPMTGWEHLYGSNSCDEEGTPDYVMETYDPIRREMLPDENGEQRLKITGVDYTLLADNVIRVKLPENRNMTALRIGHRIMYRYLIYGNAVFKFTDCHTVTLRNIEIERCTSVGAHISPRSSDFTFENFNIRSPQGSKALYAGNADGIHILGLCGHLEMKNCTFVGLGDDALNIHGTAGMLREVSPDRKFFKCSRGRGGAMPAGWTVAGDELIVYDKQTFHEKGRLIIKSYADDTAQVESFTGTYDVGDVLANNAYFASVHLDNCEVRHTRARGFLLQSRNVLVENCRVYGMSLPAIIVSPDINYWYEVGPSDNVEIRNCHFEKCAFVKKPCNVGMIVVKACHDDAIMDFPAGVHTNMRILHNTFKNCGNSGIFVSATDGLRIENNRFESFAGARFNPELECTDYAIALHNTNHAVVKDNTIDRAAEKLLHTNHCEDIICE